MDFQMPFLVEKEQNFKFCLLFYAQLVMNIFTYQVMFTPTHYPMIQNCLEIPVKYLALHFLLDHPSPPCTVWYLRVFFIFSSEFLNQ